MTHKYKEVKVVNTFGETSLEYVCSRCGPFEVDDHTPFRALFPARSRVYIEQALKAVAGR